MPGTKTMYGFTTHGTALPLGYLSREDTSTTTPREEGSLIYQNLPGSTYLGPVSR